MNDLLSRSAVLEEINNLCSEQNKNWICNDNQSFVDHCDVVETICSAPTIGTAPKWISVEERLPEPFVSVLVYMPGESPLPTVHEGYYAEDGMWAAAHCISPTDEISHWAEMPEPPKEELK